MPAWAENRADELNAEVVALVSANRVAEALPLAVEALRIVQLFLPKSDPRHSYALNNLAQAHARSGNPEAAHSLARESTELSREQFGEISAEHATMLANFGLLLAGSGNVEEGLGVVERALDLRTILEGERGEGVADLHFDRANLHRKLERPELAAEDLAAAVSIYRRNMAADDPQITRVLVAELEVLAGLADEVAVSVTIEDAVGAAQQALGTEPLRLVAHLRRLATACGESELLDPAERALKAAAEVPGAESALADVLVDWASVQYAAGDHESAEATLLRAQGHSGAAGTVTAARVLCALGDLHLDAGRPAAAESSIREAVVLLRSDPPNDGALVAEVLVRLAHAAAANEHLRAAESALREALARQAQVLGEAHPSTAYTREGLAGILERLGDQTAAITLLDDALTGARMAFGPEDPRCLRPLEALTAVVERAGRLVHTLELREAALVIARRADPAYGALVADRLALTAAARGAAGDAAGAQALLEEEVAGRQSDEGEYSLETAGALRRLAEVLDARGLTEDAWERRDLSAGIFAAHGRHAEAAAIARKMLPHDRVRGDLTQLAIQLNRAAEYARDADEVAAAEPLYLEALEVLKDLHDNPIAIATVRNNLGLLRAAQGDAHAAVALFDRALQTTEAHNAPELRALLLSNLAQSLVAIGDLDRANALVEESLALRRSTYGPRSVQVATALAVLGSVRLAQGDANGALSPLQESVQLHWETLGPDHPQFGNTIGHLAEATMLTGDLTGAEELFDWSWRIAVEAAGERSLSASVALSGLALVASDRGDMVRARNLHARALTIAEESVGPDHADIANLAIGLASALIDLGDLVGAERLLERALRIARAVRSDALLQQALDRMSRVYFETGRPEALDLSLEALDLAKALYPPGHHVLATALNNYAVLGAWLNPDAARGMLQAALQARRQSFGEDHPLIAETMNNLAWVHLRQNDRETAVELFSEALAIRRRTQSDEHPAIVGTLSNLAYALAPSDPREALRHMAVAQAAQEKTLARVFATGSEEQRMAFVAGMISSRDVMLSIVVEELADDPAAVAAAFELVLRRKGLGGEALTAQRDAVMLRYPSLAPQLVELADLRSGATALRLKADASPDAAASLLRRALQTPAERCSRLTSPVRSPSSRSARGCAM